MQDSTFCLDLFVHPDVFICGGYNGESILSDLWKINLRTFQWMKLPAVMPEPAYFHCAAVTPVSKVAFRYYRVCASEYLVTLLPFIRILKQISCLCVL